MKLESFGWNDSHAQAFAPFRARGLAPGRVWTAHGNRFGVWTEAGAIDAVRRTAVDDIAVGDWVVLREESIEGVLPRRSTLSRHAPQGGEQILAANIDVLFIVCGLDGDFNLRRIERYLVLAAGAGCRPVVVLNKADLCDDVEGRLSAVRAVAGSSPAVALSARNDDPAAVLSGYASAGETAAFVGSSGAGKSTLINRLCGDERRRTQEVRASDSRGRHTTTRRELVLLESGRLVVDMPGLREVGLWAAEGSVDAAFDEIAALARYCRFRDCTHQAEPGCAVREAVEQARLDSYQKLIRESRRVEAEPAERARSKKRWKQIHKEHRRFYRDRDR